MMLKRLYYIIISVIVVIVFTFQSLIIRKQAILLKQSNNVIEQMYPQINVLKQSYFNSWKIERSWLNIDEIYDENEQKADTVFSADEKPVLLFRFSISSCAPCDARQTNIIKELQNSSAKYRMICDYPNRRSLITFKRMNGISEIIYNSKKLIDSELDAMYFCIYYQDVVSDVFFPDENFPELTKSYLKEMSTKYFTVE